MATHVVGTILDPWGRPAVGVPVSLLGGDTNLHTVTDSTGAYDITITSTAATTVSTLSFGVAQIAVDNTASGAAVNKWCGAYGYPSFTATLDATATKDAQMRVL